MEFSDVCEVGETPTATESGTSTIKQHEAVPCLMSDLRIIDPVFMCELVVGVTIVLDVSASIDLWTVIVSLRVTDFAVSIGA